MNEQSSVTFSVIAADTDGRVSRYQWRPEPIAQGALDQCARFGSFELAVDRLDAACTSADDCAVTFEELQSDSEGAEFRVIAPELRAPIGVTYQLDAIDNDGGSGSQQSTFCLIAINEAPEAEDDSFTVLEGQVLTVTAEPGQINLLSNDVQDDHISNRDLSVLTQPSSAPQLSSSFSLQSDGGFTYVAGLLTDRTAESVVDTFVYSVTDGTHISNATVSVKVVAKNDPPEQIADIPVQKFVAGVEYQKDLSEYFNDAEGSTLSFAIAGGALPVSGALTLSADGMLSGTAELIDEGMYTIQIVASDGSERIAAEVEIEVVENLPVVARQIATQPNELGELLELNLSDFFTDPEGEPLIYKLNSLYNTATIDVDESTGAFTAEFTTVGRYTIDVSASDGFSVPVSARFVVIVSSDNVAPVFRGTYGNRNARVGVPITPVITGSLGFSDANDDELTYTITGTLPKGLTLSPAGVVSGIPTEAGNFPNIRFIATDPLGKFARSNAFRIRVLPAL